MQSKTTTTSGILHPHAGFAKFQLARHQPAPDLRYFVERYWHITWDLRGQPSHVQETLPHPSVNLVFEHHTANVYGVVTGKFSRRLAGQDRVLGVKFRPGGFYPFVQSSMARLTDLSVGLGEALGFDSHTLEQAVHASAHAAAMIAQIEAFLRTRLPAQDAQVAVINQMVSRIIADRSITKVDDVAALFHLNKRWLQRVFNCYVGVSPKWVIKRYRLQEAAEQLANDTTVDWARLALDLGYFDQSHFIRDFKTIVGSTPVEYARMVGQSLKKPLSVYRATDEITPPHVSHSQEPP
ncbi:MAG: helix-turn-helix domain-containing protein [Chloroflexi bacterium AL-W]|nr:helix-turn-helix domain-containing protein [Chloroflexi bacterium AL-N1]NOK65860.1 helix-turn-helix domain-containing protein [Chloroflexi bacterium AL-N10]NOK74199.1 helix-turn-helix domain-containing protein [Chloroflexi bacterium AL-N5]NOK80893.1 helix-turn-helix domain-containing protein [Chloroflexi bacterium AL-W]NOK88457.1 helix-turn-helix domain-containing protein [Chloroflexi bacterium AL-N15]